MYPVFVHSLRNEKTPIPAMPGQYRYGIDTLAEEFDPLVANGLESIILFGVPGDETKDGIGSAADMSTSPVIEAIKFFRGRYEKLLVACDVCICAYTDTGHCGIVDNGYIDNEASTARLAQVSLKFAQAG
jgi:porphobilinogen synthase